MAFNCPLSRWKADQLIDQLSPAKGHRVLDAGCGNGEFLMRSGGRLLVGEGYRKQPPSPECLALLGGAGGCLPRPCGQHRDGRTARSGADLRHGQQ